jgi:glycosyltransferase involved in cell wall biosynthesis
VSRRRRLHYVSDPYRSLQRTACTYRALLAPLCTLVPSAADAEVVLLHLDMRHIQSALAPIRRRRRPYIVGYLVWETDRLLPEWAHSLAGLQEIWTPSAYCHALFSRYHPRVRYLPHVIDPPAARASPHTLAYLRHQLGWQEDLFYFLTVTKAADVRKNTELLQRAFSYVHRREPGTQLVVKTLGPRIPGDVHVECRRKAGQTVLDAPLSDDAMAGLYQLAGAYVSAHHSEGWGLPMADAMAAGLPVVGTAYSGNLDFMTRHNALLVSCDEVAVGPQGKNRGFMPEMRWAQPHQESLERQMLRAYRGGQDGSLAPMLRQAGADVQAFAAARVQAQLRRLLEAMPIP